MVLRTPREGYVGCGLAISGFDIRHRLKEIDVPVMAIAGEEDPSTRSSTPMIHAGIRGAELS